MKIHLFLCGRTGYLPGTHYKPGRLRAYENFVAFYENGAKLKVKGVYASDDSNLPMDHDGKSLLQRASRYSLLFEQVEKPCEADS